MLERDGTGNAAFKKVKLEENSKELRYSFKPGLLTLSDDVLLIIFFHLDPIDLLSLSECSQRLANICCDKTLWERVDLRPHRMSHNTIMKCLQFLQASTKFLATQGFTSRKNSVYNPTISKSFLKTVSRNAPNLKTLILENHIIDSSKLILEDFPASLEHLGIRNCVMTNLPGDRSYFLKLNKTLPKLKILDLTGNDWFPPHSLLALSKSPSLEELILTGCDVRDALPYASLAANFGFSSLKALDLRNTNISDIEVTCFNRMSTLRHLYLCGSDNNQIDESLNIDTSVTDYSIVTFGGGPGDGARMAAHGFGGAGPNAVGAEVIILQVGSFQRTPCKLETLVIRNYPGITDLTLKHAASFMKSLKFIDVTGSGCSEAGILDFKNARPEVRIQPDIISKV
ncbi:hypothetical protein O3M35_001940 [Rhynocoris fuscipes]|uniref:F-box domain-containing protein n=1 Tax=Rhynocoris fuscipes TaxID=488301 RepID=A0AAW1CRT8_9HEMI